MGSVRYYETVLGDHPSTTSGPPVSLGWNFAASEQKVPLHQEEEKASSKTAIMRVYLGVDVRVARLKEFGVTEDEMNAAVEQVKNVQREREETNTKKSYVVVASSRSSKKTSSSKTKGGRPLHALSRRRPRLVRSETKIILSASNSDGTRRAIYQLRRRLINRTTTYTATAE